MQIRPVFADSVIIRLEHVIGHNFNDKNMSIILGH